MSPLLGLLSRGLQAETGCKWLRRFLTEEDGQIKWIHTQRYDIISSNEQEVKMKLRIATPDDIDIIQALRIEMLKEVAGKIPQNLPNAIHEYLNTHIQDGSCLCILMENEEGVIGKAMLCIYTVMPDEINISGKCAALFSVFTLPKYRGHGYMQRTFVFFTGKGQRTRRT